MTATGPILVTGPDRSGTTLLYALLATHPEISMVRRTNMWRWFDRRFGDLSDPNNLDRCLETMSRYRRLEVLKPDFVRIREEFLAGVRTYGRLFALFHEHHAARRGRRRWGDKSLHTEYAAERIFAELHDAVMIQLVRDPRDRYASIQRRYEDRGKGVGAATGRWLASVHQGRRNVERYPDRYLLVRYETLASEPEEMLRTICAFLGEEYTPLMLNMQGVSDQEDWSGNSSFGAIPSGAISTRSIGRYRTVLAPHDVAVIQSAAGPAMAAHGYRRDPLDWTMLQKSAFYAVRLPAAMTRLAGWWAMKKVAERRNVGAPEHRLTGPSAK